MRTTMARTLYVALLATLYTVVFGLTVLLLALTRPRSQWIDRAIRQWARLVVGAAGIDITTENAEVLDRHPRFIIIANHTSYFDIPCLQAVVRQPLRFLAKKSLFVIPIFGWALQASGFIPIDRKDRRTAVRSFDRAASQLRVGKSIVVFPEEGRSRTSEMRPFKRGAFLLALKAGIPIIPVAIRGTLEVLPAGRWSIRPGPVRLTFGEPVLTSGMSVRQKDELASTMRAMIETMLEGDVVIEAGTSA